jgi:hypothetical protein
MGCMCVITQIMADWSLEADPIQDIALTRAFRTRPFRRTRTQTEVRNSDSDLGSDLRNRDLSTP